MECRHGGIGLGIGVSERSELKKEGGLDRVESRRATVGFGGKLPFALQRVDLGKIDVGGNVFRIEAHRLLEVGNRRGVVFFLCEIQTGVQVTEHVIWIELDGAANVTERVIQIAAIEIGAGELALDDIGAGGVGFSGGEQRVVVVKNSNAALHLEKIESKKGDEGCAENNASRRCGERGEQEDTGACSENGETYGRNVEIALGKEIDGEGVEAEGRGQGEHKPTEGKREDGARGAEIESSECDEECAEESDGGPESEPGGNRESIEVVHVDGEEQLSDVTGKDRRGCKEEIPRRKVGAFGAGAGSETTECGDTRIKVDREGNERGSEARGQGAKISQRGARIEKFVAKKNDRKEQCRFLAKQGGEKEKGAKDQRRERSGDRPGAVVKDHGEEHKDGTQEFGEGGYPGDGFGVDGMEGEAEGGPEGEEGSVEGSNEQINQGDHSGVQQDVNKVPADGMLSEELEFHDVSKKLERAIVVGANVGFRFGLPSEVPNFAGEDLAEVFALKDDRILEDLELVVGDEVVAEGRGVEDEGEEEEEREMKEAGAGGGG